AAVGVHRVDLEVAVTVTLECDLRSITGPDGPGEADGRITRRVIGQPSLVTAVGVHRVDLEVAVTVTREHDLAAVVRPGRGSVICEPARQLRQSKAIGIDG